MTQEELAEHLGLTFQQIQKFEGGDNRVSTSYLFVLTRILGVPVNYFFSEIEATDPVDAQSAQFWMTGEGLDLWMAYQRLKDAAVKKHLIDLVKAIAAGESKAGSRRTASRQKS
jgi:transcriptional regulator with XRE-family HTH domain